MWSISFFKMICKQFKVWIWILKELFHFPISIGLNWQHLKMKNLKDTSVNLFLLMMRLIISFKHTFCLPLIFFFTFNVYVCLYIYVPCECGCLRRPEEGVSLEPELQAVCVISCRCWESNCSDALTAELFLQLILKCFKLVIILLCL